MVSIDEKTGIATMLRSGQARASYHLGGGDKLKTTVDLEVRPAVKLSLAKVDLLSSKGEDLFVPFLVQSEFGNETTNFYGSTEHSKEPLESSLFDCTAKFPGSSGHNLGDFFDTRAVFNFDLRSYACQLTPKAGVLSDPKSVLLSEEVELVVMPLHTSRYALPESRVRLTSINFCSFSSWHPHSF